MNTKTIISQKKIDVLSGEYLNGEFDGATGGQPNALLWGSSNYRQGYLKGVEMYFNQKFGVIS